MGCGASNSRLNKGVTVESQESLLSTVNNTNEARDMCWQKLESLIPFKEGAPVQWVYRRKTEYTGFIGVREEHKEEIYGRIQKKKIDGQRSWKSNKRGQEIHELFTNTSMSLTVSEKTKKKKMTKPS